MANGEQNGEPSNGEAPETKKSDGWRGILITAAFSWLLEQLVSLARVATICKSKKKKSSSELQLEREKFESDCKIGRQKLDEDLIKLALQSPEIDKRKEALSFMVETGLIADSDIREGCREIFTPKVLLGTFAGSAVTLPVRRVGLEVPWGVGA